MKKYIKVDDLAFYLAELEKEAEEEQRDCDCDCSDNYWQGYIDVINEIADKLDVKPLFPYRKEK